MKPYLRVLRFIKRNDYSLSKFRPVAKCKRCNDTIVGNYGSDATILTCGFCLFLDGESVDNDVYVMQRR